MMSTMLDPINAALHLGITSELLFSYASRPIRTLAGERQLRAISKHGRTRFGAQEIDDFNAFLSGEWAAATDERPSVPRSISAHLRVESGGECARCGSAEGMMDCHIIPYAETRCHHHVNLIRLCGSCHPAYDQGLIPRGEIEALKAALVERTRARLRQRLTGSSIKTIPPHQHRLLGRNADLAALVPALQTCRSILVSGVGGIGKTQLVLHALKRAECSRAIIWIPVEQCGTWQVVKATLESTIGLPSATLDELASALDAVAPCIVFDGVERLVEASDLDTFTDAIEALQQATIDTQFVFTSQIKMPSVALEHTLRLAGIDPASALELLSANDRSVAHTQHVMESLVAFADGHPLTLRILAALLVNFGSADVVLERLQSRQAAALEMPARQHQTPGTSLDLCLGLAFQSLNEAERILFWSVAHAPAGLDLGLHLLSRKRLPDPQAAAAGLLRWHLVEQAKGHTLARISMLSPVVSYALRAFTQAPLADEADVQFELVMAIALLVDTIDRQLLRNNKVELATKMMEIELNNALEALRIAAKNVASPPEYPAIISSLASDLMVFLFSTGRFQLGIETMRVAANAQIAIGQWEQAVETLSQLKILAERAGDKALASATMDEARCIALRGGIASIASLKLMQANSANHAKEHQKAAALAAAAYELHVAEASGNVSQAAALALFVQAQSLEWSHLYHEALPLFRRALKVFTAHKDPINRGSTLHHIANCLAYTGQNGRALATYAKAAEIFHRIGAVEFRSNALGEAGLLLAEGQAPTSPLVDDAVLISALDDIIRLIIEALAKLEEPASSRLHVLTRKLVGLIALTTLTARAPLLAPVAERLHEDGVMVLLAREPANAAENSMVRHIAHHFHGLALLCHLPARQELIDTPSVRVTLEEVHALALLVERLLRGHERDIMYKWLALYLRCRRGVKNISAGAIRAAVDGLSYDEEFRLDEVGLVSSDPP